MLTVNTYLLITFAVVIMLSVRDWTQFAPSCPQCGARRSGEHNDSCSYKDKL